MRHLRALTGLRFFAAFEVVVFHLGRWEQWPLPAPIRAFGGAGFLAVTLFFVLSGFILTYTYLAPDVKRTSGVDMYLARFARIYPVYLLGLIVAAPLFAGLHLINGPTPEAVRLLFGQSAVVLLMAQAYVPDWALAWNAPSWSISVEMFFYITFPLIAPRLLACSRTRALWIALGGWLVAVSASVAYTLFITGEDPEHHTLRSLIDYFPLMRLPDFTVGIVTGRLFLEARGASHPSPKHVRWILILGLAVPMAAVASTLVPELVLHGSLLAPFFALLVFGLAFDDGYLARFLGTRPIVALGEASYALYVLHAPVIFWMFFVGEKVVHRKLLEDPAVILETMGGLVLLSVIVHRGFEAPIRKRLRGFLIARANALRA